jgi:hypothetical protein
MGQAHWMTRALCGSLACFQRFLRYSPRADNKEVIGRIQYDPEHIQEWIVREPVSNQNQKSPRLRVAVVLLFSIANTFLEIAPLTYIIGLSVYLDCVRRNSLDVDAGQFDIRNIFIFFWSYTSFCICVYCLLISFSSCKQEE